MKRLKYIFLATLSIVAVSCSDFLEEDLKSYNNSNEYGTTEEQINAALYGAYSSVGNNYVSGYNSSQLPTDLQKRPTWSTQEGLATYTYTAQNDWFYDLWTAHYRAIKDCNYVMQVILNYVDAETGQSGEYMYRAKLAQARGLRGYLYFNLVRYFGEVPIVEFIPDSPSDEILKPSRATMKETLEFIIADLSYASKYSLKESDQEYQFGLFSRNAALGFLAKLHLWIGSATDRDDGNVEYLYESARHYQYAIDYVKEVIGTGAYSLTPYYPDVFDFNTEDMAKEEVIFGVVHNDDVLTGGSVGMIYGLAGEQLYGGSYGMVASTSYHATLYELSDSVRLYWNAPRVKIVSASAEHPNGYLEGFDYYPMYAGSMTSTNALTDSGTRNSFGKFRRYPLKNPATYNQTAFGLDEPVLRFADLLLIYAEASNEIYGPGVAQPSSGLSLDGTNITSAYDAVNLVRKRARTAASGVVHENISPRAYITDHQNTYSRSLVIDDNEVGYAITATNVVRSDGTDYAVEVSTDPQSAGCVPDWGPGFYGYMPVSQINVKLTSSDSANTRLLTVAEVYKNKNYSDDKTAFRQEILNERARELVGEVNDRWFDLTRRGELRNACMRCYTTILPHMGSALKTEESIGGGGLYFNPSSIMDHMNRLPIPSAERDSNGNLTQNPGY